MEKSATVAVTDPYQKTCQYRVCGEAFKAKRTNQEYCCPEHKIKANNGAARTVRILTRDRDMQAKRNRKILDFFYSSGKTEVSHRDLEFNGFNVEITSRTTTTRDGRAELHYYEYSLVKTQENLLKIIKK